MQESSLFKKRYSENGRLCAKKEMGAFPNNIYENRLKMDSRPKWKWAQPLWSTVWEFLRKLKIQLLLIHDPATPLLGIHVQTEVRIDVRTPTQKVTNFDFLKMHTDETALTMQRNKIVSNEVEHNFSAAVFVVAKTRTRPERPPADGPRRCDGAPLVLQCLSIRPPTQGTRFLSLVQELRSHMLWSKWAHAPPFLKPGCLQRLLRHKRSPHSPQVESSLHSSEGPAQPKLKDSFKNRRISTTH